MKPKDSKVFKHPKHLNSMAEQLIQNGFLDSGIKIVSYEHYPDTSGVTISQLKNNNIIPKLNYGVYNKKRPDSLFIRRLDNGEVEVIATIEYKQPSAFRTEKQIKEALEQCNNYCQIINSRFGVVTDGQLFIWINPRQDDKENIYLDKLSNKKRSYSIISNEDKRNLSEPFRIQKTDELDKENLEEETKNTLEYVERILSQINQKNSSLIPSKEVDPLPLAKSVWQDIYANTSKTPTKCLYNVVELFIFKFLSDLGILTGKYSFAHLIKMSEDGENNKEVLKHYAKYPREKIVELFPKGEDDTTIINGTIFVDKDGNAVDNQANLFKKSIDKYNEFESLKNVKKEFKTKLFETFLKQSSNKSRLGQFFTPRKVVRAIVDMADVENLPPGARLCDPFCGVGGFILESIQKPNRKKDFIPKGNEIKPSIEYIGFDKGDDDEESRTIILAKANMLIYLSDIIEKYPFTKKFAKIFNNTFHLLRNSNLGTLKKIFKTEKEKFDLILTNPPYITSGVGSIKYDIKQEGLENEYTKGGKGVEGLALEWIVRSLKKGGRAFIVVPDSILELDQNKKLRDFISESCFVNCIISLPTKTFFSTPKKTYILGIEKKQGIEEQEYPVFSYLVNSIGETLDATRREQGGKNDLETAKNLFNAYKGSPKTFPCEEIGDPRCKLINVSDLNQGSWIISNWWEEEEKVKLGIENEKIILSENEFYDKMKSLEKEMKDLFKNYIGK